ncbi:helix-turn-helix domain-containing protein [Actinospica robiniae]|uniref:helix-turn-helix domain-containing protein n=1 Tax=Actinospica robiniae TaxID=304901 RepID=UPI0004030C57|nr:helix-turn-helix domain-containing protein [Actinospica robiniae]
MAGRGRPKAELTLTATERAELLRAVRVAQAWQSYVLRCQIVLASADGATDMRIAQELGVSIPTVGKWRARFRAAGIDGLVDVPRPGRGPAVSREERAWIAALAAGGPGVSAAVGEAAEAASADHWTLDALAEAVRGEGIGVGRAQLLRILEDEGVRWRRTTSDGAQTP